MFKPIPNAKGCIVANLTPIANVMLIDDDSYAVLASTLGEGGVDHTFIRMGTAPQCEYIRVQQLNSGVVTINRGEDGTIPLAFLSTTEFEYVLTAAAVEDMISVSMSPPNLSIVGIAPVEVTQLGTNNFEIYVPVPEFQSTGNTVDVTGTFPSYDINVVRGANGCCD